MLTLFPALLRVLPGRIWGARAEALPSHGFFRALGGLAMRRPRTILVVAALAFVVALPFALELRFDRQLFAQPSDMPPSRVQHELEARFGQRDNAVLAFVETRAANDTDALEQALRASDQWLAQATTLRDAGLLHSFQSLSSILPSQRTQHQRRAELDTLDPKARAARIRAMLTELGFDDAPFAGFLAQMEGAPSLVTLDDLPHELDFLVRLHLHREPGDVRVVTYLYPAERQPQARVLAALDDSARVAGGVITGRPLLETTLREAAQRDLFHATWLAMVIVALLVIVHHRTWRASVSILAPLMLAWVLFGATLTWLHIPLNLFNLLAVPLVVGYGIDDHVFLFDRFEESGEHGRERSVAGRPAAAWPAHRS